MTPPAPFGASDLLSPRRVIRRVRLCVVMAAVALGVLARPAHAGSLDELGPFERESVDAALAERGLAVDTAPAGKRIGRVWVRNFDVFGDSDGAFLRWFNWFHRVTSDDVVEREVLLRPGDLWDATRLDESLRAVRSPSHSNVVVILPVRSPTPGLVDLIVVTRDVWSLRLNSDVQFQGDTLTLLSLSIAENNFLGWRKQLALAFSMDQGAMELGPTYVDPNIAGTHLRLDTRASILFGRQSGEPEGSRSNTTLSYPLWSLAQRFGGELQVSHYDSVVRSFQGSQLRTFDASATPDDDALPWQYHYTQIYGALRGRASFGRAVKQDVSLGYEAYFVDAREADDFEATGAAARQFRRAVLPLSEVSSAIAATYAIYTPTYATYRDFATYDLREDYLVGPSFSFGVTQGLTALGSDSTYTRISGTLEATFAPHGSYLQAWASWAGRLQDDGIRDHRASVGVYLASPMLGHAVRLVLRSDLASALSGETISQYGLGGDNGLRAHAVSELIGAVRLRMNLEVRSVPWRLWALRIGGAAFWDLGGTADTVDALVPTSDLGIGLRILIPQFNTYVFRVDWAFATQGVNAGWPGRVSFGFLQAF